MTPRPPNQAPPALDPVPLANLRVKRLLDLVLGVPALACAAPVLGAIWLGCKLAGALYPEDRGPAFFGVYRNTAGRARRLFKVRLSVMDELRATAAAIDAAEIERLGAHLPEADRLMIRRRPQYLVEDLSGRKYTHLGRLVKAFYLDELPQVFNVVRGDLSLVGPRPFPLYDGRTRPGPDGLCTVFGRQVDYRHRNMVPGGLTGLYQTNKSARAKQDYATFCLEGVDLDRAYYEFLRRASPSQVLRKDLEIIFNTFRIVLEHEGV